MDAKAAILRQPWSAAVKAVQKLLYKSEPAAAQEAGAPATPEVTGEVVLRPIRDFMLDYRGALEGRKGRLQRAAEAWTMYDGDPELEAQADGICDDALKPNLGGAPFEVLVSGKDEKAAEELAKRTTEFVEKPGVDLYGQGSEFLIWAILEGDSWGQPIVDWDAKEIVAVRRVEGMDEGFFVRKEFDAEHRLLGYTKVSLADMEPVAVYAPWQLVQFSWKKRRDYGRPMFSSAIKTHRRLEKLEETMAVARQEAYVRIARIFDKSTPPPVIDQIMRAEAARTREAGSAARDLATNLGIQVIDPSNTALRSIDDVMLHKNKMLTAGRKPKGLLAGHGEEVNRAVLDRQMEGYSLLLGKCDSILGAGFIEIIKLQWLLWLVDVLEYRLRLQWTEKSAETMADRAAWLAPLIMAKSISKYSGAADTGHDPRFETVQLKKEAEEDPLAQLVGGLGGNVGGGE